MTDVKSKNLYELLGNDHDQDSDKEPEPPVKTVDKPLPRAGKRDAPKVEQTDAAPRRNYERRGGGFSDGDRGFRDRTNARNNPNPNRENPVEATDGQVRGRDSGPGTQRGGRGRGGPRRGGDRQNKTGRQEHEKQEGQGWGRQTGEGEQDDEKAGEQLAAADQKEATAEDAQIPNDPIPEPEPEPEDNSVSYTQYLEQQAQKKLSELGLKEARAPNEGSKENKKWKNATALEKSNESDAYFVGEARAKRERERTQKKQVLDIDYTFKEPARESTRGGRGGRGRGDRGDRSDRGRGDRGRGDRGSGGFRGDRGDRGDRGRGRADRADRADRPDTKASVPVTDDSAFPALGGK